jgi:chloride channel protein, CIC family
MTDHVGLRSSTTEGLPISPSLGPSLATTHVPPHTTVIDRRVLYISGLCVALGFMSAVTAEVLKRLIGFFTNLSFFGRLSTTTVSPAGNQLGLFVIVVPVFGAVVIGLMARYGSKAIRGHGIPEAMEKVLTDQSRIPARMTFLKPLSAAISIGTGGPFGAEGPIIATGGALGSLIGQILRTTSTERKTLLAAGAAAGMAATFGSPVSAVLLAIELLLFEFRPRSLVPVALASVMATGLRRFSEGTEPVFAMPDLPAPSMQALTAYCAIGALVGVAAVFVTRLVYVVEDAFEKLPIHWMWWPAIGAIVVGVVGYVAPRTLGVGYDNISDILSSRLTLQAIGFLCIMKFTSWCIALGSGTSGGTLAPLFTVGGGIGALLGGFTSNLFPHAGIDPGIAALVGMAAMFAGASRALLTSVVFAFETTRQPMGLLPLLGGCSTAYLLSCLLMRQTIMTEKIARRGIRVPTEYGADFLDQVHVYETATKIVVTLRADQTVAQVRSWLASTAAGTGHQGFPVTDALGVLIGVITRRDLADPPCGSNGTINELIRRSPVIVYDDCTLREATDHMVRHDVGRLPVISRKQTGKLVGILTRSDILKAHRKRLDES